MTIFDYLLPIIYKPLWSFQQKLQKTKDVAFYAADPLDYEMFLPILKHLDMDVIFIAKNAKTCSYFQQNNIPFIK